MGIATWASGPLFDTYGGRAYAAMAALGAIAAISTFVIRRRWNQGVL
jgi:hypothetical protein